MKITQKKTPNQNKGRSGKVPIMVVCHRTSGSFEGAVSWLCNEKSGASSHFVVSKQGAVVQLVDIQDTAWCNGTSTDSSNSKYYKNSTLNTVKNRSDNANNYTVSIEFEGLSNETGKLTAKQLDAGVELIKFIVSEVKRIYNYDIKIDAETLVGHCHITPKWKPNCPGNSFPFKELIERVNTYMKKKIDFYIDGEHIVEECIIEGGKTYTPVRPIAETMGSTVIFDKTDSSITINTKK